MTRNKDIEHSLVRALQANEETEHLKRILKENQIIRHNFKNPHERTLTCALEGCSAEFSIHLFPNQLIYPKFCSQHRSEFQREFFKEQNQS